VSRPVPPGNPSVPSIPLRDANVGKDSEEYQALVTTLIMNPDDLKSLAVPRNQGANRLLWAVPALAIVIGAWFAVHTMRRFQRRSQTLEAAAKKEKATAPKESKGRDEYDDRLDQELKDLDNE